MGKSLFRAPIDLKKHTCLIYAEGVFGLGARKKWPMRAKTADGILRYANYKVVGIVDSASGERQAGDVLPAYLGNTTNFPLQFLKISRKPKLKSSLSAQRPKAGSCQKSTRTILPGL